MNDLIFYKKLNAYLQIKTFSHIPLPFQGQENEIWKSPLKRKIEWRGIALTKNDLILK